MLLEITHRRGLGCLGAVIASELGICRAPPPLLPAPSLCGCCFGKRGRTETGQNGVHDKGWGQPVLQGVQGCLHARSRPKTGSAEGKGPSPKSDDQTARSFRFLRTRDARPLPENLLNPQTVEGLFRQRTLQSRDHRITE